jgi:3-deoxy-D-manno-octulosonate 8-phosphate phosphatase (KDO 8-P phosphatase)
MQNFTQELKDRAKKVKLLLLDVDGVLTDGRIIYDSQGRDLKFFDVHDGMGVHALYRCGIKTVLITAKGSKAIRPRARDMQVLEIYENISPKSAILKRIIDKYKLGPEEICFVGDDLVDLGLMKLVGFPVAVFNACPEVKQCASYITIRQGGRGAVREMAELILKAKERWDEVIQHYSL